MVGTLFLGVLGLASWGQVSPTGPYWYSIVPPLLAVSLALLTRQVVLSLSAAVVVGGFLAKVPAAPLTPGAWLDGFVAGPSYVFTSATDTTNLQIIAFVVLVMAAIAVMITSGGLQGIVNWLSKYARGPRSAQFVTVLMGLLLFIDDYANTMIIGNSLRPMTDKHKISREKLAFLVDATSAPVAGIALVSTWIGYEIGLFSKVSESLGLGKAGYAMFFDAITHQFYCWIMIIFVLVNAISGRDYGPMKRAQKRAREHGHLMSLNAKPISSQAFANSQPSELATVTALSALAPIAVLFCFLIVGLWLDGGGGPRFSESPLAFVRLADWREVISASENSIKLLAYAAGMALIVASVFAVWLSKLPISLVVKIILQGFKSSVLPLSILILAWSLKGACDGLDTGKFLGLTVGQVVSPWMFPSILFIVAGLTAFATGTSWGTMAILIPTAIPIAYQLDGSTYGLVTLISLGAVLDGSIFGDHCSPISDTTIMSSISSSCDHIHHVETQIPYSLTVAGLALVCGYLPASFGMSPLLGVAIAGVALILLFGVVLKFAK